MQAVLQEAGAAAFRVHPNVVGERHNIGFLRVSGSDGLGFMHKKEGELLVKKTTILCFF